MQLMTASPRSIPVRRGFQRRPRGRDPIFACLLHGMLRCGPATTLRVCSFVESPTWLCCRTRGVFKSAGRGKRRGGVLSSWLPPPREWNGGAGGSKKRRRKRGMRGGGGERESGVCLQKMFAQVPPPLPPPPSVSPPRLAPFPPQNGWGGQAKEVLCFLAM